MIIEVNVTKELDRIFAEYAKMEIAGCIGITFQSMDRWRERGHMPDGEFSGRTTHAAGLEYATDGFTTIERLLGWVPKPQQIALDKLRSKS